MLPNADHFSEFNPAKGQEVKGIATGLRINGRGTLNFCIDDDDGVHHKIRIPNSVLIPKLPMVLVSPQH